MTNHNVATAVAYYTALGEKNVEGIGQYFHKDIEFIGPLARVKGKEAVVEAAKSFSTLFNTLKIRDKCGSEDHAMIVYEIECPEPFGKIPTAVLLSFQEGLISKLEIFFDARKFEVKK